MHQVRVHMTGINSNKRATELPLSYSLAIELLSIARQEPLTAWGARSLMIDKRVGYSKAGSSVSI